MPVKSGLVSRARKPLWMKRDRTTLVSRSRRSLHHVEGACLRQRTVCFGEIKGGHRENHVALDQPCERKHVRWLRDVGIARAQSGFHPYTSTTTSPSSPSSSGKETLHPSPSQIDSGFLASVTFVDLAEIWELGSYSTVDVGRRNDARIAARITS